jgi:hypothetical protein
MRLNISILIISTFLLVVFNNKMKQKERFKSHNINNNLKENIMDNKNFTTTFLVNNSPEEVFNAINNVRGWWSENILGNTDKVGAEFLYHYKDVHICKLKIVEFVPGTKVVWLVLKNHFNFTKDQSEWKGNKIIFEILKKGNHTQLQFTQVGLTPDYECYKICHDAWTSYIQGSLRDLITSGKGKPNTKEDDSLNKELIEKWGLPKK